MKQALQSLSDGSTAVVEIPVPKAKKDHLLIRTRYTLISTGTERMLVDFGKVNLLDKARQQPDKVRQVIDKTRTDGLVQSLQRMSDARANCYGRTTTIAVG